MMKKPLNRAAVGTSNQGDDERRMSALLNSSFTQKIIDEQESNLKERRERHATARQKLLVNELEQIQVLNKSVEYDMQQLARARAALHAVELKLSASISTRDGFLFQNIRERGIHEKELKESAPLISEAIDSLYRLLQENQNLSFSEIEIKRAFIGNGHRKTIFSSDRPSAERFALAINEAILQLEELKLEPDHFQFPQKIAQILAKVPNPKMLPLFKITRNTMTGTEEVTAFTGTKADEEFDQ